MTAITNLYMKVVYNETLTNQPILAVLHGWSGNAESYYETLNTWAGYGFFVVSIGMRGRNASTPGTNDASGREIYDIYDAINFVKTRFSSYCSADKVAIYGTSGGGGNALAAACKFPDTFTAVVSLFGMSDYGRDGTNGWYQNNGGTYTAAIATAVGGTPAAVPNNYYARDATAAIQNFTGGKLHLFHDKQDTTVPYVHSTRIKTAMDAAGLTNYSYNISDIGDAIRYEHGYPKDIPDLLEADTIWKPDALNGSAWTVPATGTVTVIGYIVTKRFTIWLGTGISAAATVAYDTSTHQYTVTPLTTGDIAVAITEGSLTASGTISGEYTFTAT